MKITVQDYRKTQTKHRKAKLKNVGPPFFKFMSVYIKISFTQRVWHAVCSKILSSHIFIQSNHFGVMQFNLIFQTYSNNPKKHSIQTHVSQFNLIRVNIYSIQSRKYLFNPITKIFIQSNHGNVYSIQSPRYLFNPITEIFIQSVKYLFNPITEIFIQSNHKNIYSIQSTQKHIQCNPREIHSIFLGRARSV